MSSPGRRRLTRPGRASGLLNLAVAVAALALLLPLLLNAATAAPPTAAEFAPNASQVIKQPPPGEAAATNGHGGGGTGSGGTGPGKGPGGGRLPTPPPARTQQISQNLLKACVGPPPLRQIEDPQSPPCIAYWKGDNGGATSRGVTRDSIYITVPTPESHTGQYTALQNFFNNRFQFYGRKIVLEFCNSSGYSGNSDQATQTADAAADAQGCSGPPPFASTFYRQNNGAYYMPQMGCRYHIVVVGSYSPYDSKYMDRCEPYLWQYPMLVDNEFANIGEWVCNRLARQTAQYGGTTTFAPTGKPLNQLPRKFGIMLAPFTSDDPVARLSALDPLVSRMDRCGATVAAKDIIINPATALFDPTSAQNADLQLKSDGVTSIVCMCNFFSFGTLQRAADSSSYQPEWITSTFGLNDVNSSLILGADPNTQLAHTFGVTFQPRMIQPLRNPYNVALEEGDPTQGPDTTTLVEAELEDYRALLVLASGIQMAGPHLTPQTFAAGLQATTFPNPITDTHAGFVGFGSGGYSMTDDGAEWWYSTTADGPFTDSSGHQGTVCYLSGGRRYSLGTWPHGPGPFFSGTCDSGA